VIKPPARPIRPVGSPSEVTASSPVAVVFLATFFRR
jgi:hypothetical protein